MIGLSSGSWAQILVHHPEVESLDIVEINPGYLKLIPQYPVVSSLLDNPKARIHIDDGRRWLFSHPDRRYDLIVQNTSFYWRDHSAELLSADLFAHCPASSLAGGHLRLQHHRFGRCPGHGPVGVSSRFARAQFLGGQRRADLGRSRPLAFCAPALRDRRQTGLRPGQPPIASGSGKICSACRFARQARGEKRPRGFLFHAAKDPEPAGHY